MHSPHPASQSTGLVARVYVECHSCDSPEDCHMRVGKNPHLTHMSGYDSVYSHMRRRPPPICPIKGQVLPSSVSQSLALESSTFQNLAMTDTLDYALCRPLLDKLLAVH